jgi:hypothetical protein
MPHDSIHIDAQGCQWSIKELLSSEHPRVLRSARVESLWARYANSRRWGGGVSSPARLLAKALSQMPRHSPQSKPIDYSDTNTAHADRIVRLRAAIERGEAVPPLLIGPDGILWDGIHRLAALRAARCECVDVLDFGSSGDDVGLDFAVAMPVLSDASKTSEFAKRLTTAQPFPHIYFRAPLDGTLAHGMVEDFQHLPWRLSRTDFYDQYEVSLMDRDWAVGPSLALFQQVAQSEALAGVVAEIAGSNGLLVSDIACHLSRRGQSIGVHNDVSDAHEFCRLTIHLSPVWQGQDGGHFVVFASPSVNDAVAAYPPTHNTAVLFRISESSFHAVSEIGSDQPRLSVVVAFVEA